MDVMPNFSPFPSAPFNNPVIAPYLQVEDNGPLTIGDIPENTNIGSDDLRYMATPLAPRNLLMSLRAQFPYLPIMPLPPQSFSIALTQNASYTLPIPDGCAVMMMHGKGDYYVSLHGRAEIPLGDGLSKSIYKPERFAFFVGNSRSVDIITADAGVIVTALFYAPDQLPT